ncbi:MAG TPA: mobile mystery protein B [Beijerinckiaceae bacterium]
MSDKRELELFGSQDDAQPPLSPEEKQGLRPAWITYRRELNAAEQENIAEGVTWAFSALRRQDLLTESFLRELHRRMFGRVWAWAGSYRTTERNIGLSAYRIPIEIRVLLDDVRAWIQHRSYSSDELAIRFHHRLVSIHPFPNGNGRHSRLMADLMVTKMGGAPFTWGGANLANSGEARAKYVAALRKADEHDIDDLIAFARS